MGIFSNLKERFQEASLGKKTAIISGGAVGLFVFPHLIVGGLLGAAVSTGVGAAAGAVGYNKLGPKQ